MCECVKLRGNAGQQASAGARCRYEDAGEAGDDDFMQAELDKLDQMGLTDGRVD